MSTVAFTPPRVIEPQRPENNVKIGSGGPVRTVAEKIYGIRLKNTVRVMKIGIDASRYRIDTPTGVEWYSYHLLNALIPVLGRDHAQEIRLYTQKPTIFEEELPFNVKEKVIPRLKFWTLLRLSWEMFIHPVDLLFVPSHILPLWLPRKTVVTVHDVAFRIPGFKKAYDRKNQLLLEWSTRRAVKKAHRIIVPSQATKDDLIGQFNCQEAKIVVIPHGGPDMTGENNPALKVWLPQQKADFIKKLGLSERDLMILYVGRLEFKKNIVTLLEGFSRVLKEYPDWKLVLAGKEGQGYEEIEAKIAELRLENNVVLPGYVTDQEKRFLLSRCRVFAFPSKYEGFGLPILEAFAYRRPVLTSNVSAMPEVAGDAAFLVNPEKVEEISVGLKRLIADGVLVSRLVTAGEKRLEDFSWEKAAAATFDVLMAE